MPFVEGAGVALHHVEVGRGGAPTAVLVHGIAGDAAGLAPAADRMAAAGLHVVAYDRRGYGESGAPEPYTATTVQEQAQDLIAVVRQLADGPALLVGDGFGALVVLDVLTREPQLAGGAVLRDPPLFALVPEANEWLAEQRLRLEDALVAGGPDAAVRAWLGPDVDAAALARAQAAHAAVLADYAGLASWPVSRAGLRGLTTPLALVTSPSAPPAVVLAEERIAALVPSVEAVAAGARAVAVAALAG